MYINEIFELTRAVNGDEFDRLFARVKDNLEEEEGEEYADRSLSHKGVTVIYRKSRYKKKVRLVVNTAFLFKEKEYDSGKIVPQLEKRVAQYFGDRRSLEEFVLTEAVLMTDLRMEYSEDVLAYLRLLRRIGKVKNFSPVTYDGFSKQNSFCLKGNSNDIVFMAYNLHAVIKGRLGSEGRQSLACAKGVLRAEIRLTSQKAIREVSEVQDSLEQLLVLSKRRNEVFLGVFERIVPFGDSYKKSLAVERVRTQVSDLRMRRRMLYLIDLIPEKRSLWLAQKALQYRKIDEVMDAFARIGLSPVTISKRERGQCFRSLYHFLGI